jgi:selenide,water dikinase
LKRLPKLPRNPRVLVDQDSLDDAGVYRLDRHTALVQTVDFFTPVVDDPYDYGRVAAANSLSDVYAMGGTPRTALALMCFPEALGGEVLGEVLRGGQSVMHSAGVAIIGGHTVKDPELKFGYSVTGLVDPSRMLTNAAARPGDRLILTKPIGTGILATALKHGKLAPAQLQRLTRQLTTLNRAASEVAVRAGARAATDVTGFGLLGHAAQMADASRVTIVFAPRPDWFLPGTLELAKDGEIAGGLRKNQEFYRPRVVIEGIPTAMALGLFDPQTSGGLLIAAPERKADTILAGLRRRRIWAKVLGRVTRRSDRDVRCEAV